MRSASISTVLFSLFVAACSGPADDDPDASSETDAFVDRIDAQSAADGGPDDDGGLGDAGPIDGGQPDAFVACACDDGIACTTDRCDETEACVYSTRHDACAAGQYCAPGLGCRTAPVCATDADCTRTDPCTVVHCDGTTRTCAYATIDGDGDGEPPPVCGGSDCNDANASIHPGAAELCDGVDSDCDGAEDADAVGCQFEQICNPSGSCDCAADRTRCDVPFGFRCVDLTSDESACGTCFTECGSTQTCIGSACSCESGTACDEQCVDLATDPVHCGSCTGYCGDAACVGGSCSCGTGETFCFAPSESWAGCAALDEDPDHCGGCYQSCMPYVSCAATDCTVVAGRYFRAYSAQRTFGVEMRTGTDASTGWSYTSQNFQTDEPLLDGVTATPTGLAVGSGILALDELGVARWFVPMSPTTLRGISAAAGRLYVSMVFSTLSATIGTTTLTRGTAESVLVIAELDGATGALLMTRAMPSPSLGTRNIAFPIASPPGGGVVLAGSWPTRIDLGGGAPPAGTGTSFVARFGPGLTHQASLWHDAEHQGIEAPADDDIVVWGTLLRSVDFGGGTLAASGGSNSYILRLGAALTHRASFAVEFVWRIAATSTGVAVASVRGAFAFFPYLGTGAGARRLPVTEWIDGAFQFGDLVATEASIFLSGTRTTATRVGGVDLIDTVPFIVRFDIPTMNPQQLAGPVRGGIESMDHLHISGPGSLRVVGGVVYDLHTRPGRSESLRSNSIWVGELDFEP